MSAAVDDGAPDSTNADAVEAELRHALAARLGEARVHELAAGLRATAEEIALLYATVLELEDEEPDFTRPPI